MPAEKTIFTLGTSNRSVEELFQLLRVNRIEMVVDVRSFPTSTLHKRYRIVTQIY